MYVDFYKKVFQLHSNWFYFILDRKVLLSLIIFTLVQSECHRNSTSRCHSRALWLPMGHKEIQKMFPPWKRWWTPRRVKSASTWFLWSFSTIVSPFSDVENTSKVLLDASSFPCSTRWKLQKHWRTELELSSGIIILINKVKFT